MTLWSLVNIAAADDASGTVELAWDANPEADIAGYRVQYGTTSGDLTGSLTVGTSPEATLTQLAPGTRYFCAVRAFTTSRLEGPLSSEISFVIFQADQSVQPDLAEISVEQASGNTLADGQAEAISLGSVALGSTGAAETFVIRNLGNADLTGLAITADGEELVVSAPDTTTLAPGETTRVNVAFRPMVAGPRTGFIHITSNDADESSFDIPLVGNGIAEPRIMVHTAGVVHVAAFDFGGINLGATSGAQIFTISNSGNAALTDMALVIDGDQPSDFIVTALAVTSLAPGESTTFGVEFHPVAEGGRGALLHFHSNDPDENPLEITLAGTGVASPEISVSLANGSPLTSGVSTVDLGNVTIGETRPVGIFTVANLGTADLSDLKITLDGLAGSDFTVVPITGNSLPPGASATFQITFTPTAEGIYSGTLQIASNDPDENPFAILLGGVGIAVPQIDTPAISVTGPDASVLTTAAAAQNFGGIYLAATGEPRTFTIRNSGTADLTGLAIATDGADAADFIVSHSGVTSLVPGASATFQVAFQPSTAGTRTATLHIASNAPDVSSFDIPLAGSGIAIPILALENADGTPVEPATAVAKFRGNIIGSTGDTVTYVVRNSGSAALTGIQITTSGLRAASYLLDLPSASSLDPGAAMTFKVTFKPTSAGSQPAVIRVTSNSTLPDGFQIALDGTGIAVPAIRIHQDDGTVLTSGSGSVNFGTCNLGSTTPGRTFTIKNSGSGTLSGLSVTCDGPDFNLGNLGSTSLAPGAGTTFKVAFEPRAAGTRAAHLVVTSNDADKRTFLITLTGKGIEVPEIVVELGSGRNLTDDDAFINFGTVDAGSTGKSQTFTIRNTGTAKLDGLSIIKNGISPSEFSVGALKTRSLAPGASTTFKVNFSPAKSGIRWAAIHIASNDADESFFDIVLTGSGKRPSNSAPPPPGPVGNTTVTPTPPVKSIAVIGGRKYLTLTIAKVPGTTVLPRDIEVSSDLVAWSSGKRHTTVLLDNAKTLKVRDNTPVSQGAKRYIRLKP